MGEKGELNTRATQMDADVAEKESWPLNSSSKDEREGDYWRIPKRIWKTKQKMCPGIAFIQFVMHSSIEFEYYFQLRAKYCAFPKWIWWSLNPLNDNI